MSETPHDENEEGRVPRLPLVLGALLLAGVAGWGAWTAYARNAEAEATQRQIVDARPMLRTTEAKSDDGTLKVSLPGATRAFMTAQIHARATGYVAERRVDIGSRVMRGDTLLTIAAPDLDQQLLQAQAQLAQREAAVQQADAQVQQAQADVDLASTTNARQSTLTKQGWSARQNLDNSQAGLETNRANLEAAKAGVAVAQADLKAQQATVDRLRELQGFKMIVAPFDGLVTARMVDVGDLVTADANTGTPLMSVEQEETLRVDVQVPQSAAIGMRTGLDATVTVPELPGQSFPAKIARTAGALDSTSRTLQVEVDVPNPESRLRAGLYVNVAIAVPRQHPSVSIPAEALIFDDKGIRVAVVEGQGDDLHVRMQPIQIERDLGTELDIGDGLKGGERVVLGPPVDLADGARIRVQQQDKQQQQGNGPPST